MEEIENNYLMGFSGGNDRKCVFFLMFLFIFVILGSARSSLLCRLFP